MRESHQFTARVILIFFALLITDKLFSGIQIDGFITLIAVSVLFAVLNSVVKPFLILITIPVTLGTLGFFLLIINALILSLTALLIDGFSISNFSTAFWGSITLSILNMLLGGMVKK